MTESSNLGAAVVILHIIIAAFILGVLIASAITIKTIDDNFSYDILDNYDNVQNRDRYRSVAVWVLCVGIAGIITQVIFAIVRGLYYGEVINAQFPIFGVVAIIFTILLALSMVAGAGASAANAAVVHINNYIDGCDNNHRFRYIQEDHCSNVEQLRNSQAATAGLSGITALMCFLLTIMLCVGIPTRRTSV